MYENGAFDFYVKTGEKERLIKGVQRAIKSIEMERENLAIRSRFMTGKIENPEAFNAIVTQDQTMSSIFQYVEAIAVSSQPVLITGESGVGKELIANAIHTLSNRKGPLLTVNVAGLDDSVFSDTLFGHSKGAFTGADGARKGMVEHAGHGTLFLDEIGDLSISSQVKLLRLLQEGEYFPIGSDLPKRINARIVVATHQDLEFCKAEGTMRKDLYYRLCGHHVHIPPLRERKDDIELLLHHFLKQAATEFGKTNRQFQNNCRCSWQTIIFPAMYVNLKEWFTTQSACIRTRRCRWMLSKKRLINRKQVFNLSAKLNMAVSLFRKSHYPA